MATDKMSQDPGIDDLYDDIFSRLEKEFESRFSLVGYIQDSGKRVPVYLDSSSNVTYLFRTDRDHMNFLALSPNYFTCPAAEYPQIDSLLEPDNVMAAPIQDFDLKDKFVFLKDSALSAKFGMDVYGCLKFEELVFPSGEFNTGDVKVKFRLNSSDFVEFTIYELSQFYIQNLLGKASLSLLINQVLAEMHRVGNGITFEHLYRTLRESRYNEFYLPTSIGWNFVKILVSLQYNQAEISHFNVISKLLGICDAYIIAKEAARDSRRVVLDPFELHTNSGNIQERDFGTAKGIVAKISLRKPNLHHSHFAHDSIAFANGNPDDAYVIDGMGGHVGAYFISELLSRFLAEGNDITDAEAWKKFYNANSRVPITNPRFYVSPGAVLVNSRIDRVNNAVHLRSVGDSVGIHFDADLKIVQYVGANSAGMPQSVEGDLADSKVMSLYEHDRKAYLKNTNMPSAYISSNGITAAQVNPLQSAPNNPNISGLVYSGAEYMPGDSVLLSSDCLEKVFDETEVKNLLIYYYTEQNQFIDVDKINFTVMPKEIFADRPLISGSEKKTWLSGNSLIPFFILVHHLKKLGVISNIHDLYEFIKQFLPTGKDDGTVVVQT